MSKKNKLSTRRNHHQALLQRELHNTCNFPSLACSCKSWAAGTQRQTV